MSHDFGEIDQREFGPKLSGRVEKSLGKLGVEMHMGSIVTDIDFTGLAVRDHEGTTTHYEAGTVPWTAGVEAPDRIRAQEQSPIEGTSFAYLLGAGGDAVPGRHRTQHFEMFGSRALFHDGWKAVTFKPLGARGEGPNTYDGLFDDDVWELYHVAEDLSDMG